MDAKRRRLESPQKRRRNNTTETTATSQKEALKAFPLGSLQSEDVDTVSAALAKLKKLLSSKEAVQFFVSDANCPGLFRAILLLFDKFAEEFSKNERLSLVLFKEIVSVVGNCCHFTTQACLELKHPQFRFNLHAVKVLETARCPEGLKASMLRLVGNMCAHKESALCISAHSSLVDKVAQLVDDDESNVRKMALRAVRMLLQASFSKIVLLSNAGYYLGKLLVRDEEQDTWKDIVLSLQYLVKQSVRDCGRQLAASECSSQLLTLFFSDSLSGARSLVGTLCEGSTDIRDRLGAEENVIEKIVSSGQANEAECRLLTSFAQDAWGRASLRTSGALDLLVERLSKSTEMKERLHLVSAFRHYIHDRIGLAHLCRSSLFMSTVVTHVKEFLDKYGSECKPEIQSSEDFFRPNSPLLLEIENKLQNKEPTQDHPLYKDFSSMWSYGSTSPPPRNWSSSALSSPPSSSQLSPSGSTVSSPSRSFSNSIFDEVESLQSASHDASPLTMKIDSEKGDEESKTHRHIVESEIWLWSWQTQEDTNLPFLIREDVVVSLLLYLRSYPSNHSRVSRALKRMAASRTSVDSLLRMQFHIRVLHELCAVPCRMTRFAKRCSRCEKCSECGREILREFSTHVDSDFGHAFLVKQMGSEEEMEKIKAVIARVTLVRDRFAGNRRITHEYGKPVDNILDLLKKIMEGEDFDREATRETYEGGPPLSAQIIGALSSLIPTHKIREVFEVDVSWRPSEYVACRVETTRETEGEEETQTLRFVDKEGELLVEVPMDEACTNSEYFRGMFTSDLLEKTTGMRTFTFDEEKEGCSRSDFSFFLHYLSGCRNEQCTPVATAATCIAMIELSDRYLCTSLLEEMSGAHGPARRFLSGTTLPLFMRVALSVYTNTRLLDSCLLTLMRYALPSDVLCTLSSLTSSHSLVDAFINHLKKFIYSNTGGISQ